MLRLILVALVLLFCEACSQGGDPSSLVSPQPSPSPLQARFVDLDAGVLSETISLPVIPRPKSMQARPGAPLVLTARSRIGIPPDAGPVLRQAADEVARWLGERANLRPAVVEGDGNVVFERVEDATLPAEGYLLRIDSRRASIGARDDRGFYNGAQTLKQLLDGAQARPVQIRDWPTLSFRGIHWHGGRNSFPLHQRLIERILGPLKLNTLLFETSYAQWTSQPAIWDKERSTPLDDLRKVVALARARGIEPIPLVQALSHAGWLFRNGANADLRGAMNSDFLYDVSKERTYEVIFGIYQEALEIFHPRWLHIGHDELPAALPISSASLSAFLRDTLRLHDWLKARGVGTMIWGDMMLCAADSDDAANAPNADYAKALRDGLPKDIVVHDWHYQFTSPKYPSVDVFRNAGFQVVGASWADNRNIRDFSRCLAKTKSLGLLETTWAGFALSEAYAEGSEFHQFAAYLTAAEQAWNGGEVDPLGYEPMQAFLAFWQPRAELHGGDAKRGGLRAIIHPQLHAAVGLSFGEGEQGFATLDGVPTALPAGVHAYGGNAFICGAMVNVKAPGAVFDLGLRKARKVSFLWTAAPRQGSPPLIRMTYEDGSQETAACNIAASSDPGTLEGLPMVWHGQLARLGDAYLHRWDYFNRHPERRIRSVALLPNAQTEIVIAGVSLLP